MQNKEKLDYKDIPNLVLNFILKIYKNQSRVGRVITLFFAATIIPLLLFFTARLGFLGESTEKLTYLIKSEKFLITDKNYQHEDSVANFVKNDSLSKIPKLQSSSLGIDNKNASNLIPKRIILYLDFWVNNKQGLISRTYYSGDEIFLKFKSDIDCYVQLLSIDKNNIIDLFDKNFSSQYISGNSEEHLKFILDSNTGEDLIVLCASNNPINYLKDIKPNIKHLDRSNAKGPDLSKQLQIKNKEIFIKSIYFIHK